MNRFRTIALAVALSLMSVLGLATGEAKAQVPGSKAVPSAVQRIWLAGDRIYIEVFVDNLERPGNNPDGKNGITSYPYGEHYGNRLGDIIPMRVRVFAVLPAEGTNQRRIEFDFVSLKNGRLTIEQDQDNDPDWVFAKPESLGAAEGLNYTDAVAPMALFLSLLCGGLVIASSRNSSRSGRLVSYLVAAAVVGAVVFFIVLPAVHSKPPVLKPLEMPTKPDVVQIETPDGQKRDAEMWDLRMFVQTRRRPEPMLFWMEFNYCDKLNENGQKDWVRADTPDFIVSGSYTGDKGRDLERGNTNQVEQERPLPLALLLLGTGATMLLLPLGLMTARAIQRALAKRGISTAMTPAQVWAILDPILEKNRSDKGYSFEKEDVAIIVKTFKEFLGFAGSVKQFATQRGEYDNGEEIHQILYALEYSVLEREELSDERKRSGKTTAGLSDKRYAELLARIEKLCPRP